MTNQFLYWDTDELSQWVEDYLLHPLLQTPNNIGTFFEALKELDRRLKC